MDNQPGTTPTNNDSQSPASPSMDIRAPGSVTNLSDVSMSPEQPTAAPSSAPSQITPAGGLPSNPLTVAQSPADNQPTVTPASVKKSGSKGKVMLIILIALILAAAAVYFYVKNKNNTGKETGASTSAVATQPASSATNTSSDVKDTVSTLDGTVQKSDSTKDTTSTDLTDTTLGL